MKNLIRVAVVTGLLAWPGLEIYRIHAAKKQLAASEVLGQSISQKLASLQKLEKVAEKPASTEPAIPVSRTGSPTPSESSESQ